MAIFYIDPSGNDSTGTGSIGAPWQTLAKATSTVTSGNTIYVNPGTYLEVVQCFLAPGVNLSGAGDTSIIQSTWPWSFQAALALESSAGTMGNQSVSKIKLDGRIGATGATRALSVYGRSNVEIHDITVVDWKEEGVIFNGADSYILVAPPVYATGNTFHHNTIINCSQYVGSGSGCLEIGGQDGLLIHDNHIEQQLRTAPDQIGWPIKYFSEGFLKGCKIYNNTIIKAPFDGGGWNFAIELFNFQGLEIYNNTIYGALDFNFQGSKGSYPWVTYIHDNIIGQPAQNLAYVEAGLIYEYDTDGTIVENNTFKNISTGLSFFCRPNTITRDFIVRKNLFYGIGNNTPSFSYYLGGFDAGTHYYTVDNFKILNNTFIGDSGATKPNGSIGMGQCDTGYTSNIEVRNNHIENTIFPPFGIAGAAARDNVQFTNNNQIGTDFYGIGTAGAGTPLFPDGYPTNYTTANNLHVNGLFVPGVTYALQSGSTLINAGINVGLPFYGPAPDIGYAEFISGNSAPVVYAGADQTITLPTNSVFLSGNATDFDGVIISYQWTKDSGPASYAIATATSASTVVSALTAGTYVFTLTAIDNSGGTGSDSVTIVVNPVGGPNIPPVAHAGNDQTIMLPVNAVTLSGNGTDTDGTIVSYAWSLQSGPSTYTIVSGSSAVTDVTALGSGIYLFLLTVTDDLGSTGTDTVQITVNTYTTPAVFVGLDKNITLPTNSISLTAYTATPGPSGLNYILQSGDLSVSPWNLGGGATAVANQALDVAGNLTMSLVTATVNTGGDVNQLVAVNQNTTYYLAFDVLRGTISNCSYFISDWGNTYAVIIPDTSYFSSTSNTVQRIEFPFTTPTGTNTVFIRIFGSEFQVGNMYIGRVTVSPTSHDTYALTTTSAITSGSSGTTIVSHSWTKQSGPATYTITSPTASATTVTGLIAGTYIFRDTVTDSASATAYDEMQTIVNPSSSPINTGLVMHRLIKIVIG